MAKAPRHRERDRDVHPPPEQGGDLKTQETLIQCPTIPDKSILILCRPTPSSSLGPILCSLPRELCYPHGNRHTRS